MSGGSEGTYLIPLEQVVCDFGSVVARRLQRTVVGGGEQVRGGRQETRESKRETRRLAEDKRI